MFYDIKCTLKNLAVNDWTDINFRGEKLLKIILVYYKWFSSEGTIICGSIFEVTFPDNESRYVYMPFNACKDYIFYKTCKLST